MRSGPAPRRSRATGAVEPAAGTRVVSRCVRGRTCSPASSPTQTCERYPKQSGAQLSDGTPVAADLLAGGHVDTDDRWPRTGRAHHSKAISEFLAEDLSAGQGDAMEHHRVLRRGRSLGLRGWDDVITRQMQLARDAGALAPLAFGLNGKAIVVAWTGDFEATARVTAEADAVTEATGSQVAPFGGMLFAALRGREAESFALIGRHRNAATGGGAGFALQWVQWTTAMLCNGSDATRRRSPPRNRPGTTGPTGTCPSGPCLNSSRLRPGSGRPNLATEPLARLVDSANVAGSDWALGIAARSKALLSEGADAESLYQVAIRTCRPPGYVQRSPAPICSTASGFAVRGGGPTHGATATRALHALHDGSGRLCGPCPPRAASYRREGAEATKSTMSSPHKKRTSHGSPPTATRTCRSVRSCSSARGPSSGTSRRCS